MLKKSILVQVAIGLFVSSEVLFAHEINIHKEITKAAVAYLAQIDPTRFGKEQVVNKVTDLLNYGSEHEDDDFFSSISDPRFPLGRYYFHFWPTLNDGIISVGDGTYSEGRAINNSGQVTGTSFNSSSVQRAFFWNGTAMVDIGDLGGGQATGRGINNLGHITGVSRVLCTQYCPDQIFLWDGTTMTDIGSSGGFGAGGINDNHVNTLKGNERGSLMVDVNRSLITNGTTDVHEMAV